MVDQFFSFLDVIDDSLWSYLGFPAVILLGFYLSWKARFMQIRKFPFVVKTFFHYLTAPAEGGKGVPPLHAFFAGVGGCIGIGNIVAICTAVQIGGPGALFWVWVTAMLGVILKYSEIYLGMRYRVSNEQNGYDGGPMYFLRQAFKKPWVSSFVCLLLCVYGVEIYQFSVVTNSLVANLHIDKYFATFGLLLLVIFAGSGGVQRVGKISSAIIPFFVVLYLSMGAWVLWQNIALIPAMLGEVFSSAFTGHAAVGGFAGSSILVAASQGIRRGCYTGDVGVGYASVIHSESSTLKAERQASLAIFDIFLDTFVICSTSVFLILLTGVWKEPLHELLLIQTALGQYFPYMHLFMPLFLFLLGYSTIIAYFCVGLKCAEFLAPKYGRQIYYLYAVVALWIFSFFDPHQALIVMSTTGALLLITNLYGIFRLRDELSFTL